MVSTPVRLQSEGVKRLIEDVLWVQGLREKPIHYKKLISSRQATDLENGSKPDVNYQL
jgi:hypothetical protein